MGKIRTFILSLDGTFKEKRIKTEQNKLLYNDNIKPTFSPASIFHEEKVSRFKFWKSPRKICLYVDGATEVSNLKKLKLNQTMFSIEEIQHLVKKVIGKTKADQKILSTWQTFGLFGLMGLILFIQIYTNFR